MYTVVPKMHRIKKSQDVEHVDEGAVVSMLSSEVEKLGGFAGSAISGPLLAIGTLVFVLGYMFWVEPLVASIAIALYSPQFFIVPFFQSRMNRLSQKKSPEAARTWIVHHRKLGTGLGQRRAAKTVQHPDRGHSGPTDQIYYEQEHHENR